MRGFRGSRAASQAYSRFDRIQQKRAEERNYLKLVEQPAQPATSALPDWVKTPETRAREKEAASRRAAMHVVPKAAAPVAKAKASVKAKAVAKPRAAAARKPAARKKSAA